MVLLAVLSSCSESTDSQASRMLRDARLELDRQHYVAARDSILEMRRRFPTAIAARKQGILLLDSVEWLAAVDSLRDATGPEWERLHIKQQFFERKLQEDIKKGK